MKAKEVLVQAKKLISDPAHWTQRVSARNAENAVCQTDSPDAVCWCSYGAVYKIGGELDSYEAYGLLTLAAGSMGKDWVTEVNDDGTHANVMQMFSIAIELAGASDEG